MQAYFQSQTGMTSPLLPRALPYKSRIFREDFCLLQLLVFPLRALALGWWYKQFSQEESWSGLHHKSYQQSDFLTKPVSSPGNREYSICQAIPRVMSTLQHQLSLITGFLFLTHMIPHAQLQSFLGKSLDLEIFLGTLFQVAFTSNQTRWLDLGEIHSNRSRWKHWIFWNPYVKSHYRCPAFYETVVLDILYSLSTSLLPEIHYKSRQEIIWWFLHNRLTIFTTTHLNLYRYKCLLYNCSKSKS